MAFYPNQLPNYFLAGSGAVAGATSIILRSMTDIDGNSLTMATSFGSIGYATLEPGNGDLEESISFTGLTNNANGTTTLTGVSSITFGQPYTATSGLSKTHAGSTTLVISNTSAYYTEFGRLENDETITGFWSAPDPVDPENIANRQWVLSVINGGAVSQNAVITTGTAGETVSAGKVVYYKAADGRWWLATDATVATLYGVQLGIAQGAGTAGNAITGGVLLYGVDTNQSGLAAGTVYYVGTAGALSSSAGTNARVVANGISATSVLFNPFYQGATTSKASALVQANSSGKIDSSFIGGSTMNFGDGSDSDETISSGTTTLTRDMFYDNLTVDGTGTLATAGYRVFVKGTATIDRSGGGGGVHNDGGNGGNGGNEVAGTAGSAAASGSYSTNLAGAAGGNGATGNANGSNATSGAAQTFCMISSTGSSGGAGGDSGTGRTGGTAGGGGANTSTSVSTPRSITSAFLTMQYTGTTSIQRWNISPSGGGGGGGACDGSGGNTGGGGGGSGAHGGFLFFAANALVLTGTGAIRANGGNGGNGHTGVQGSGNSGGGGGGAGGNGGVVVAMYNSKTGTGTITASGGTAGSGAAGNGSGTSGSNGTAGASGLVIELV